MKVYITQGHEEGIGLEVFFKSLLMLAPRELSHLKLLAYKPAVEKSLKSLNFPYKISSDHLSVSGSQIEACWLEKVKTSPSLTALDLGMKLSESGGVLFTLPTSKDQFPMGLAGHTEYFRSFYRRSDLGMFFSSPDLKVLLLSDHLALKDVPEKLSEKEIYQRLETAVKTLKEWDWPIERILVSGLNPHAGEGGLLGKEDARVNKAVERLTSKHKLKVSGPYPGDTMLLEQKSPFDLLVYLYHDQGLGVFKGQQGFIGSNITLGLPYPRVSPDHGTSFGLFGKNAADYRGCLYSLREAISLKEKISHGKNSGH